MLNKVIPNYRREDKISCACGCGELIRAFCRYTGTPRKIKNGHQNKFFTQQGKYKLPRPWFRNTNNPSWKGGRIEQDGYIKIRLPDHPHTSRGYIFEHRYVMEQYLGRYLTKDEDVHHINGDKKDNQIENLQLISHSNHSIYHNIKDLSDRVCYVCSGTQATSHYKPAVSWLRHPVTKQEWLCHTCYQRIWYQLKREVNLNNSKL